MSNIWDRLTYFCSANLTKNLLTRKRGARKVVEEALKTF